MRRFNLHEHVWNQIQEETVKILQAGGVVAAPTETVYGLLTLWTNTTGRERIFALKKRAPEKQLQMLAPNLRAAEENGVREDQRLKAITNAFCPGPLTVVVQAAGASTIGLRIPDSPFLLDLLARLPEPLAATSANRSGTPPANTADQAISGLHGEPDLLIDGGTVAGEASTVVSLLSSECQLLREGPLGLDEIQYVLARLQDE